MLKLAAIGELECIWPFSAYGVAIHAATTGEDVRRALAECLQAETGVVFITETAYESAGPEVQAVEEMTLPALCILPDPGTSRGLAERLARERTRRAVGADVQ